MLMLKCCKKTMPPSAIAADHHALLFIMSAGLPYWKQAKVADKIDLRVGAAAETLSNLLDVRAN